MPTTPYTLTLEEGTYRVTVPPSVVVDNVTYNFKQWEDGSTNPERIINLTSDMTITAYYVAGVSYTLTITTTTGGTTYPTSGSYTYPEGASVTVRAVPNSGFTFDHWELDGANIGALNPVTIIMDKNHILRAVFTAITIMGTLECHAYIDATEVAATVDITGIGTYITPFTIDLAVGTYTLNAIYNTQTQTKTVTVTEGVITRVDFTFAKAPVTPPVTGPLGIWTFPILGRLGKIFPRLKQRTEAILTNIKERWKRSS
jgi:hypothetical protein